MVRSGGGLRTESDAPLPGIFASLPVPRVSGGLPSFATAVMPGGVHRVGKDPSGAAALLIATPHDGSGTRSIPLELQHLVVQYDVRCLVWHEDGSSKEAIFTLIRCREPDRILTGYFLRVIESMVPLLGANPSEAHVRELVGHLAELFRALQMPPRKTVQGLWAELFVIAEAASAEELVAAWHISPSEPFDFSHLSQRIEVKSTAGPVRQHHFSLQQVSPPAGTRAIVVSLLVERAGGGVSVAGLATRIRSRLGASADLMLRAEQVVAASLGQDWRVGLQESFDSERAAESLAFFWEESVPCVSRDLPRGVTDVRFCSDLTNVVPIDSRDLHEAGGIFRAALPVRMGRRR